MNVRGLFVSLLSLAVCAVIFLNGCGGGGSATAIVAPAPLSSTKAITVYSLAGVAGTINEAGKTIAVAMPSLTNVTSLVATFTTTGVSVKVGATAQESGVTANNFIIPLACTVTAADGTMTTYSVTVTINRAWHHPASLSDNISPDGAYAYTPRVAMDNNGNAIIVWYQWAGANYQIFKSEYRGGVWHHPASLADNISPDGSWALAEYPQVAMDNNGNAIIVWQQYLEDSAQTQIFKSEYRLGIWTHPTSLSDHISPNGFAGKPQVAMDDNGSAIIVWQQVGADGYRQIFKSEYRGGVWTHPTSLDDHISSNGQTAEYPQVAMDNSSNAIIAWHQYGTVFKSEYRGGAWTHPASITDHISPDGGYARYPQVAMDDNGNAIIIWSQSDGANYQIFKSEYRNRLWHHPASLADNISPDGQDALYPQVAMDNNGNAIIAWYQYGTHSQVFKSEYRGGAWTHPASLADNISPDGQDVLSPQVAMDNNGNAIIVWTQIDGTNYQIFKSEYRSGVWTHPSNLADHISPDGSIADGNYVAMGNNGNAIIVWNQSDGANYQIFKSEYR